jgi:hypothetical protein
LGAAVVVGPGVVDPPAEVVELPTVVLEVGAAARGVLELHPVTIKTAAANTRTGCQPLRAAVVRTSVGREDL